MKNVLPLSLLLAVVGCAHAQHEGHHPADGAAPAKNEAKAEGKTEAKAEKKGMGGMMQHHHGICAYESKHYSVGAVLPVKGGPMLQCVAGPLPADPKAPQVREYSWQVMKK